MPKNVTKILPVYCILVCRRTVLISSLSSQSYKESFGPELAPLLYWAFKSDPVRYEIHRISMYVDIINPSCKQFAYQHEEYQLMISSFLQMEWHYRSVFAVAHQGPTLYRGHYVSYRMRKNMWYEINDNKVNID